MSAPAWICAISDESDSRRAIDTVLAQAKERLDGSRPSLVFAFITPHHASHYMRLPALVDSVLGAPLLGCSAAGVIGQGREIEGSPGICVVAASLPNVRVTPFSLGGDEIRELGSDASAWSDRLGVGVCDDPRFILLPDPFSSDAEELVAGLDAAYPAAAKIGGLASGGREPEANVLYANSSVHRAGVAGVALCGDLEVVGLLSQGCRPIGSPLFVTRCDGNVIKELDGRNPLEVLSELYESLPEHDRQLMRSSLFVGILMQAPAGRYECSDFLVRSIVGVDREGGAVAVSSMIGEKQALQFHLRDKETSARDLERVLSAYKSEAKRAAPLGALLFSCLGRGRRFYGCEDHDSALARRILGELSFGGFFCNGEIGAVHGSTFLHGYTSAFALFASPR